MKKKILTLALILVAVGSLTAAIRGLIRTSDISPASPARYVTLHWWGTPTSATYTLARLVYPHAGGGRLVDVVMYQYSAGTGGTSVAVNVRNSGGTSLLTTAGVMTLASGDNISTDAKGLVALPSGWTRPVIKTDSTPVIAKGGYVDILLTESGTYSPHPIVSIVLVFEPLQ